MLSVIIPALNEEANVARAVRSALAWDGCGEVIVADGGSADATAEAAAAAGAQVVRCGRGRALQMNAGAAVAGGQRLLFLHADSELPAGYGALLWPAGAPPCALWGCFCSIAPSGLGWFGRRIVRWCVEARTRLLHRPYGDQALWVEAGTFRALGGFRPDLPLLEDVELTARLRKHAGPPLVGGSPIATSGRRWATVGLVTATVHNQIILIGWALGVDPARLAAWYYGRQPAGQLSAKLVKGK